MELGHRPRILCRGYLGPECVYVYVAMMAVKLDERRVVFMYILTLRETFPLVDTSDHGPTHSESRQRALRRAEEIPISLGCRDLGRRRCNFNSDVNHNRRHLTCMGHAGSRSHKGAIRYGDTTTSQLASYRSTC